MIILRIHYSSESEESLSGRLRFLLPFTLAAMDRLRDLRLLRLLCLCAVRSDLVERFESTALSPSDEESCCVLPPDVDPVLHFLCLFGFCLRSLSFAVSCWRLSCFPFFLFVVVIFLACTVAVAWCCLFESNASSASLLEVWFCIFNEPHEEEAEEEEEEERRL